MMATSFSKSIKQYQWSKPVPIEPLIWFRIIFGILITFSSIRFVAKGWVYELFIAPKFYFSYFGWDWIKPIANNGMYAVLGILILSGICITLGLFYRVSIITFSILFAYIELIDKSNYLNHYYFIFLISFLLIWVPANRFYSLDIKLGIAKPLRMVARWNVDIFKFQIGVLYFFAGIAKLNYYWLFEAQPLTNWLKHQSDLPLIGGLMKYSIVPYIFAWFGCFYDLTVTFFLCFKKTRIWAYVMVIIFHSLVGFMFPIGVFPLTMILLTTIFFDSKVYERLFAKKTLVSINNQSPQQSSKRWRYLLVTYIVLQLFIPLRHVLYTGELFWNERGYRFSWRVMLIEKVGYTEFYISPENDARKKQINVTNELSPNQIKMMSTQPDMILEYAHHLKDSYMNEIIIENGDTIRMGMPQVFVNSQVSLFNQGSRPFVKSNINLIGINKNTPIEQWLHSYE
ncbi:MAG: hypothetical protein ACI8Q1_000136 [Parvicella sp.]|jgi:hypothetical protein